MEISILGLEKTLNNVKCLLHSQPSCVIIRTTSDYFSSCSITKHPCKMQSSLHTGIAAIGANYVSVGIHTGTILLFEISTDEDSFVCRIVDSQRSHAKPVTDLASTTTSSETMKDVMNGIGGVATGKKGSSSRQRVARNKVREGAGRRHLASIGTRYD
jgi:hypothetical protein